MGNPLEERRNSTRDLIKAAQQARAEAEASVAVAEPQDAPPQESRDVTGELFARAKANGLDIQAEPPAPAPVDRRTPQEKIEGMHALNPAGFNKRIAEQQAGADKSLKEATEQEVFDAARADWERKERKRQEDINAEIQAGRKVDLSDPRWRANQMPVTPESLRANRPAVFPEPPGDEDPIGAMRRVSNDLVPGSEEAKYRDAIEAVRSGTIGGKRLEPAAKPYADSKSHTPEQRYRDTYDWTKGGQGPASKKARGEKAPGKPAPKMTGGDRRPMSDVDRQISEAEARGAETQNRIDNNLGLSGTELQGAMFGAKSLRPARPQPTPRGTRIGMPSALGAGDDVPAERLTPEQLAMRSSRRWVAAPMGAANGGSKWGIRALPEKEWNALHAADPVAAEKYRRLVALEDEDDLLSEMGLGVGADGKLVAHGDVVLERLANKLGIPTDIPHGERLAEAKRFYDEQTKLRQTHDVVNLPTGGAMYRPNAGMQRDIDDRKANKDINDFSKAHPYENMPTDDANAPSTGHLQEMRTALEGEGTQQDREKAVAKIKQRVRSNNADARNRAYKDQLRQRGMTQNLRNPNLAPAMFQDSMREAYAAGDPMAVAAAREQWGDRSGANQMVGAALQREATDAEREVGLAGADAVAAQAAAQAQLQRDQLREKAKSTAAAANDDVGLFLKQVADENYQVPPHETIRQYHTYTNARNTDNGGQAVDEVAARQMLAKDLLSNAALVQQMKTGVRPDLLSIARAAAAHATKNDVLGAMRGTNEQRGWLDSVRANVANSLERELGVNASHQLFDLLLNHAIGARGRNPDGG